MNKDIVKIVSESDIPVYLQQDVVALMEDCWNKYYKENIDTHFDTPELRDFWFYLKVVLLAKNTKNINAVYKLSKLLDVNARKYINPNYKI